MVHLAALPEYIPSPPVDSFHIGPLDVHFYALGYIIGITLAILITRRRWRALGGDPDVVNDIALWVVPAGIIGGRIYFDITTPADIPHVWYGVFAVWTGGLGIWGGVALATAVGAWRLRRLGITVGPFANAIAPALLVAQAVGRIGNYFNKELFGRPTTLPWGLEIPYQYRVSGGIPAQDLHFATFQPTFLYELIGPGAGGRAGLAGAPREGQAVGAVRAVRGGLLGVPHLRGIGADRLLGVFPRPAAEHVHRDRGHRRRADLVRSRAAPPGPPGGDRARRRGWRRFGSVSRARGGRGGAGRGDGGGGGSRHRPFGRIGRGAGGAGKP